jgi:pimeloyl-ACP methyl ester carboxylesterase
VLYRHGADLARRSNHRHRGGNMATKQAEQRQRAGAPAQADLDDRDRDGGEVGARRRLLAGRPVAERRLELAGISTAVLEGGEGPPIVLLHGPGESAANWRWVIPGLAERHRVIAPDLPAHGSTEAPDDGLDAGRMLRWLGELIERTCGSPPALVGHVLGGAIGARFAIEAGERLSHLVLVDSLGLARFRPSPRFALGLVGFVARPSERSYERFMRQCAFDLDSLQTRMGEEWESFAAYNLELARGPKSKAAGKLLRKVGVPRIEPEELARITVPTSLIWGRQDRANRLRIAEAASDRYGWPLRVIEESADDPARDQPEAFLRALHASLGGTVRGRS